MKHQGHHNYKRCGFEGFIEIICCPLSENSSSEDTSSEKAEVRGPHFVRKSEKACQKYSKNLPLALSYHIVGGVNAEEGEFPHMAALGFYVREDQEYKFDCGGTLISSHYIVTAAHCVVNVQQNELKIARLGKTEK